MVPTVQGLTLHCKLQQAKLELSICLGKLDHLKEKVEKREWAQAIQRNVRPVFYIYLALLLPSCVAFSEKKE